MWRIKYVLYHFYYIYFLLYYSIIWTVYSEFSLLNSIGANSWRRSFECDDRLCRYVELESSHLLMLTLICSSVTSLKDRTTASKNKMELSLINSVNKDVSLTMYAYAQAELNKFELFLLSKKTIFNSHLQVNRATENIVYQIMRWFAALTPHESNLQLKILYFFCCLHSTICL